MKNDRGIKKKEVKDEIGKLPQRKSKGKDVEGGNTRAREGKVRRK